MNLVGKRFKYGFIIFALILGTTPVLTQDNEYFDSLLQRIDTIENPVYMPMVSVDYGSLIFIGDVRNSMNTFGSPAVGNQAIKVNISTFIDNKHYFLATFHFLSGELSAEEYLFSDETMNLNFKTEFIGFGAGTRYHFQHFLPSELKLKPYVGLGVEVLLPNVHGEFLDKNGQAYHYWPDGSIRTLLPGATGTALPMVKNYDFETSLNNQMTFGIPIEIGISLKVSQRITFGLGAEYHYTLSDLLDNISQDNYPMAANKSRDGFLFTKASIQLDLFSEPKTKTVDLLYADLEMDPIFYDDEDGDFILDHIDKCPGTPYGVLVDSLGCPFDTDGDGVPDYLDKEADTPPGAWVDDEGVTINEDDFRQSLNSERDSALNRKDLDAYMKIYSTGFIKQSIEKIPEKFARLDKDADGYISFDELLLVIDDYFDFKINLSLEELRELNEFFFSQ